MEIDRIVQFSPLVRDMNRSLDAVHGFLGAFPSRRNRLPPTGVDLAVMPFGYETFLELIAPIDARASAAKLLERTGEGWFMLNVDVSDAQPVAEIDREIRATGARVVAGGVHGDGHAGSWHLHPADTGGVLLALYVREDRPDHRDWAGAAWTHFVETNRRVVDAIAGVSIATNDMQATARQYEGFGFHFGDPYEDADEQVMQASLPGGTFLQLRSPLAKDTRLAAWLEARGPGLYHLAWQVRDIDRIRASLQLAGGRIYREAGASTWATALSVFGMPLEFVLTEG